jgi:hypothetical protein
MLSARSQTVEPLPPETRFVGLSSAPPATEETFTIAAAQDLTITLTDLQTPAALSSATVVVTQGGAIVQIAAGNAAATLAPPATSATLTIPGAVGEYTLRVFGTPSSSFSVGTFTVCVAPQANPSACIQDASLAGNISSASTAADPTVSTLSSNLTVTTAGNYTVAFADAQFPAALNLAPNLALFLGSTPIALGIQSGASFNLSPGVYTLLAIAQADQTIQAGLYSITISGPAGVAPLIASLFPVGTLAPAPLVNNPSAQTLALNVTDFAFPSALAGARSLVSSGGTIIGMVSAGSAADSFAAPAGPLQIWSFAAPGTDAGTYEVDLNSTAANLYTAAFGVANGNSLSYAYVTQPLTAGAYQADAGDLGVPAALLGLSFAVAQNDVILQKSTTAGSVMFTAAAGPVVLLVDASIAANGNGLFGIDVQSGGAAALLFDKAQGVTTSGLFDSQEINLGTAGDFNVTLTDLKFPAQFQDLALVVSQGSNVIGKAFGGGTFPMSATPGSYQLTFIATPAAQQQYGMYGVQVVYAAPSVTLTASPVTVSAGGLSTLAWTTTDATSCSAGGGNWSGNPATGSGNVALIVTSTTIYTLTCMGPGGTTAQSVTVTTTAAAHSGGGGAMDLNLLIFLVAFILAAKIKIAPPNSRR